MKFKFITNIFKTKSSLQTPHRYKPYFNVNKDILEKYIIDSNYVQTAHIISRDINDKIIATQEITTHELSYYILTTKSEKWIQFLYHNNFFVLERPATENEISKIKKKYLKLITKMPIMMVYINSFFQKPELIEICTDFLKNDKMNLDENGWIVNIFDKNGNILAPEIYLKK